MIGDKNDQSSYNKSDTGIVWGQSTVGTLVGGSGEETMALKLENYNMNTRGLTTSDPVSLSNHFQAPKVMIHYGVTDFAMDMFTFDPDLNFVETVLNTTSINTNYKLEAWRDRCMSYFRTRFGLNIPMNVGKATNDKGPVVSPLPILNSDSNVVAGLHVNMRWVNRTLVTT